MLRHTQNVKIISPKNGWFEISGNTQHDHICGSFDAPIFRHTVRMGSFGNTTTLQQCWIRLWWIVNPQSHHSTFTEKLGWQVEQFHKWSAKSGFSVVVVVVVVSQICDDDSEDHLWKCPSQPELIGDSMPTDVQSMYPPTPDTCFVAMELNQ